MSHAIIYTPLQLGEIRLLTIHPGTSDSSIQCNLDVTSLTTAPEYEALSYVWGLPGNNKFIAVGNRPFEVGWNLEVALRYLRLERKYRRLWIDAICIDQTNSAERSTQVASMHRIYSGASSVLIWLGELDERRERAFDFIEQAIRPEFSLDAFIVCYAHEFGVGQDGRTVDNVKQTLKGFSPSSHPSRILDLARNMPGMPLYTPMDKMDISMALGHIFSACGQPYSWWSRLWVVQEVLYARSARIICGSRSLDLADFQGAEDSLHLWVWNLYSVLSSVLQLEEMRTRLALFNGQNPTQSLEQALIVLRERYCTDPKDWIYAILNVAKSGCFGIKPDYSKSTQLIYAEAAKVLIADSRSLDSITLWKGPHAHQKYGHQPVDNLPTWTPDFSTLASSGFHQSTKSQTMSESTRLYSADKGTIARPFEVSKKGDIADVLNVQAASIGIVKNVSICGSHHLGSSIVETWARLAHQAEMNSPRNTFLETWTLLSQQSGTYPTGETIPEAFCRTCLKDINDYSLSKKTSTPFQPNLAYSRLQKEHLPALLKGLQHAMLNNDQSIASSAEFLKRIGGPDEPNHQVFFTTEGGLFWLDACGCGNWG